MFIGHWGYRDRESSSHLLGFGYRTGERTTWLINDGKDLHRHEKCWRLGNFWTYNDKEGAKVSPGLQMRKWSDRWVECPAHGTGTNTRRRLE